MAGVRGRSGGARPGAGRKPKEPQKIAIAVPDIPSEVPKVEIPLGVTLAHTDPKLFLLALMNDLEADVKLRADAAKALMPFMHTKLGEGGKKEQRTEDAKRVAGRFSPGAPPRLAAAGGKKV